VADVVATLMANLTIAMEVGLAVATAAGLVVAVMAIGLRLFWMSLNCLKSAMRKMKNPLE